MALRLRTRHWHSGLGNGVPLIQAVGSTLADKIDIGRPSRAFPVTPPGIRVPYHGGSDELKRSKRLLVEASRASRSRQWAALAGRPHDATLPRNQSGSRQLQLLSCAARPVAVS